MLTTIEARTQTPSLENLGPTIHSLIRTFEETRESSEVWEPVKQASYSGKTLEPWHPCILPSIFERLSFFFLHHFFKEKGLVLLSPQETRTVYRKIQEIQVEELIKKLSEEENNPDKQGLIKEDELKMLVDIHDHFFPPFSIGKPKPDGLILIPGKKVTLLAGVMEATTCTRLETNDNKQSQLNFLLQRDLVGESLDIYPPFPHKRYSLATNTKLGEVIHSLRPREIRNVPVGLDEGWEVHLALLQKSECSLPVIRHHLPFDYDKFRDYASTWLMDKIDEVFPNGGFGELPKEEKTIPSLAKVTASAYQLSQFSDLFSSPLPLKKALSNCKTS